MLADPRTRALLLGLAMMTGPGLACAAQALAPPALPGLIEAWRDAQAHDPDLAVARSSRDLAQPRRDQADALWRPAVGLQASAGLAGQRSEVQGARFSAPGFGSSQGVGFGTDVGHGASAQLAVVARQSLYDPERRARQQMLRQSADQADQAWRADEQEARLRLVSTWFEAALADVGVEVLDQQAEAATLAGRTAEDRFRAGAAPVTEPQEARARLAEIEARRWQARTEQQLARARLAARLGHELPSKALALPAPGQWPPVPGGELAAAILRAADEAPRLRQAALDVSQAREEAARYAAAAAPTVDLVAQVSRDRLHGAGDAGDTRLSAGQRMIGVQLQMPLWTSGWRDARRAEALRGVELAEARLAALQQQQAQQVRAAWWGLAAGRERVRALEAGLLAAQARADATRLGRDIGERTLLDLLNAQSDLATNRLGLAQARASLWLDHVRLAASLGQLDDAPLEAVADALAR